jgi:translocation and assembly module TamB
MSSEPELSQEDIVLLLTLGMTRHEMDQLQAGDVTGGAALEAIGAASGVEREVRRAVGVIDEFRVGSAYSQRTNTTVPQLSIGRRLTERVRLTASTGLGEDRVFQTGVEVRTGENTSVQAVYDNTDTTGAASLGNVGVDLRWRLEFE